MTKASELLRNNVEKILTGLGWNQTRLAREIGIPQPQLSRWLSGLQSPGIESAKQIADALGVPLESLFREGKPLQVITREPTPDDVLDYITKAIKIYKLATDPVDEDEPTGSKPWPGPSPPKQKKT